MQVAPDADGNKPREVRFEEREVVSQGEVRLTCRLSRQ